MRAIPCVAHVSLPLGLSLLTILSGGNAFQISSVTSVSHTRRTSCDGPPRNSDLYASSSSSGSNSAKVPQQPESSTRPPPVLNGKTVLPIKVLQKGLEGHTVAAVYALLSSDFKKGTSGWEHVMHVATTLDLASTLDETTVIDSGAAHVRALSFVFPQRDAMESVAAEWRESAQAAGGVLKAPVVDPDDMLRQAQMNALSAFDDEDDDDDDDDDDDIDMMMPPPPSLQKSTTKTATDAVISPFAEGAAGIENRNLPFTSESVNLVLDEVRPYLIADGGNVSVDRVDEATRNVYLKLEGACGSCPR